MHSKKINLISGKMAIGMNSEIISTVLGSCISICIFDIKKKIGGMNHYIIAEPVENKDELLNYGITAIPLLIKEFKKIGSEPKNLKAKIIGGSVDPLIILNGMVPPGIQNINIAHKILIHFGIEIVAEETGGNFSRQVEFNTGTGEIRFKKISKNFIVPEIKKLSKIKVLIIDDSIAMRKIIRKMIEKDPIIEIIGEAEDPLKAIELRKIIKPDVITLDLHMPKMDGVTYLRQYMPEDPIPTIIVTDYNLKNTGPVMDALDSGAFDYVQKPELSHLEEISEVLISKIKAASAVNHSNLKILKQTKLAKKYSNEWKDTENSIVAIGASTGGTEALKVLLTSLPKIIPPIFIVQHMPPVFTKSFADRLNELCPFTVKEAEEGDKVQNGIVYIAPGGIQMAVVKRGGELRICLVDDPPENRFKPSVDFLFRSFGKINGMKKTALLLTGMGNDGAKEMLKLRKLGVHTIVQDESTCVVFGMPKAAIDLGAAVEVSKLEDVGSRLLESFENHKSRSAS